MHPHIFIIDDFLSAPIKNYTDFIEDKENPIVKFFNSRRISESEIKKIEEQTYQKLSEILGSRIEIIDDSNISSTENTDSSICAHIQSDWIALIYLQLPLSSLGKFGVRFYSHKQTGSEFYSEGKKLNTLDESQWKEYSKIPVKYNRMVLFKSRLWHSYGNGFGDTLNNSMLYKKIIIRNG